MLCKWLGVNTFSRPMQGAKPLRVKRCANVASCPVGQLLYHSTSSFLFCHFLAEFQGFDYDQRTQPGLVFLDVLTSDVYLESTWESENLRYRTHFDLLRDWGESFPAKTWPDWSSWFSCGRDRGDRRDRREGQNGTKMDKEFHGCEKNSWSLSHPASQRTIKKISNIYPFKTEVLLYQDQSSILQLKHVRRWILPHLLQTCQCWWPVKHQTR